MKTLTTILTLTYTLTVNVIFGQVGEWTWMKGDNFPNQPAVYGTQGISSPTNKPPAVYEPIEWIDLQGNFWLMGGVDWSGLYNDLWKYDPNTNEWTWIKGQAIINQSGNYGTQTISSPTNLPGGRGFGATSWIDSTGNLWLLGGWAHDAFGNTSIINDLWTYNISSNEWTWMKGSNLYLQPGVYGTMGVSNPTNTPGARYETCASWTDNNGNLWFFGGGGRDVNNNSGYMNDVWRYNILSNEWTWMNGSNQVNAPAVYGTKGVPAPSNTPGGRWIFSKWIDEKYNLWIFGGEAYDINLSSVALLSGYKSKIFS